MVEFVVNLWNHFASPIEFEREMPALVNGRRMAALGIKNRIHLCFLAGLDRLRPAYLDELRELGFTLHDCSALATELAAKIPVIVARYKNWGGIRHFGMLRFLTMPRVFGKASIITFDGDMVVNAPLDEIERVIGNTFTFLDKSSCFGSVPATSGFFEIFEEHLMGLARDPEGYARAVMRLPDADSFFDPHKSDGTDQGFIMHLFRQGIIPLNPSFEIFAAAGLCAFPNWLKLGRPGLMAQSYERRSGIDYLGGRKVLISHMSHDTCVYLGQFLLLQRWLGEDGMRAFGRVPVIFNHYDFAKDARPEIAELFSHIYRLTHQYPGVNGMPTNPYRRSNVIDHFYGQGDFSGVFNDTTWHTPGVFEADRRAP